MFYRDPDGDEVFCRVSPTETLQETLQRLGITRVTVDGTVLYSRDLTVTAQRPGCISTNVHRLVSATPVPFAGVAQRLRAHGYAPVVLHQALGFLDTLAEAPDHILRAWLTKTLVVTNPGVVITLPDSTRITAAAALLDIMKGPLSFVSRQNAPLLVGCSHFVLASPQRNGDSVHP